VQVQVRDVRTELAGLREADERVEVGAVDVDLAARLVETGTGRSGSYIFGRLEFDPTKRTMSVGSKNTRLTPQQTALVVHLAQGSKPATAGDLISAGLFRPDAARSTVHSALLTLRRKLDDLEPDLGSRFLLSTARGYSLGQVV
jgi:DNA-binding response OmpR family regulator